ncbi:hypothetical protein ASG52_22150 [Methylobacterium sp. Leaf456]|uniref:hypothetical protein n=1 Tax=Methylobacterium sp. Leaf456 TaxID=1736382 RepID=UPI0006FE4901|nr:hypothetical protein [Methylobacterium sp. Leaf456]KQT58158.1 hypothetical protein ASG52_22150 [Methylobacterium sp. Leaf456]
MARYQIIDAATGRKCNVVEWDGSSPYAPPDGQRIEPDDGTPLRGAPVPSTVLPAISDRQFAQALADLGVIARAEALAFVKRGEVPTALQAAIDAIPDPDDRFAAEMQVSGATTFERAHPSTLALAHALGWSDAQMDELWRSGAGL